MAMRLVSHPGAPFTLRLDQQVASLEGGLRFQDEVLRQAPVAGSHKRRSAAPEAVSINVGMSIARLVFTSQLLIVLLLGLMVFAVIFICVRASSSLNYYYWAAAPYMNELRDRGMNMVRNADEGSIAMAHLVREADGMASSTLPGIAKTMNASVAAVDRLVHLARNPVMKISVE